MSTIKGLNELVRGLSSDLDQAFEESARMLGLEIVDRISIYPLETAANNPSNATGRWYDRGTGGFYRRKRDGRAIQTSSSETLGRRWAVEKRNRGAQILNLASYASIVHRHDQQAGFHSERGWRTDVEVAEEIANDEQIMGTVKGHIVKALGF